MELEHLIGRSDTLMREVFPGHFLHGAVVQPYLDLVGQARLAGFDLRLASGFRSFERQMEIWNSKALGQRPVYDDAGQVVDLEAMPDKDKVCTILRWSALPGASRHHWGTDVDVWDCSAVESHYSLQLQTREYLAGGPFFPLMSWLDKMMLEDRTAFTRPYTKDRGGVAPEPWHLSYMPVARNFEAVLTRDLLFDVLSETRIALKQALLENFDEIYQRFVAL